MALDDTKAGAEALDDFQKDALIFFGRVPEPPLYRRRDDPSREVARALLHEVEPLLARGLRQGEAASGFYRALEAHAVALALMEEGRVEAAEPAWHEAVARERAATSKLRLWRRTDEQPSPVYEREKHLSRFDPRDEARLETKLGCPWCRKVAPYSLSTRLASHALRCPQCTQTFTAYVGELRKLEVELLPKQVRRYRFRLEEPSGQQTVVEFDDGNEGELLVARRDLVAFLYAGGSSLRGVINLNSSRVLWVSSPRFCFVATAVLGETAPELQVLRAFRDRVLFRSLAGRTFIAWYYQHGLALAGAVKRVPAVRASTRWAIRCLVPWLEKLP